MKSRILALLVLTPATLYSTKLFDGSGLEALSYLFSDFVKEEGLDQDYRELNVPYDPRAFKSAKSQAAAVMECRRKAQEGLSDAELSKCLMDAAGKLSDSIWTSKFSSSRPPFECSPNFSHFESTPRNYPPAHELGIPMREKPIQKPSPKGMPAPHIRQLDEDEVSV